ncbi:MAG TPA: SRPBCC family protein [Allosphingosinicella sp.]|jgi:hypothetical protein|nr:SRPBCC family protein [Allosphingosinicella sp.]
MTEPDVSPPAGASPLLRIVAAVSVALVFAFGVYLLLDATRPQQGLVSFSFLLVLPAAISAFACYVGDPLATRPRIFYLLMPIWLLLAVIVASVFVLREGVICIIILSPLWLISSWTGAAITWCARRRIRDHGTTYCSAALLLPMLVIQAEPYIPLPQADVAVTRSIVVNASPDTIWPLLRGIPDVHPGEGRWNLTQDVIGVPRPLGARLVGEGIGAERLADWGRNIRFRERITEWQPGSRIGWHFIFDQIDGWRFTDRHLMPDSPYFRVTTGGYRLESLAAGHTRVVLTTRYWIKTPVNAYSRLWGELFLGDLENNLLALIKGRAEAYPNRARVANREA